MKAALKGIFALLLVALSACDSPGEGKMADLGKAHSTRIVGALDKFRHEHGEYPRSLEELTPNLLTSVQLLEYTSHPAVIEYRRDSPQVFELSFSYTGPGRNTCIYRSDERKNGWECFGYY
jgi:hypothetical protein